MNQTIDRLKRASEGFLSTERVSEHLRSIPPHIKPTFLQSFPRSGNGFFRFVAAKAALAANGYDVETLQEERRHYYGKSGTAWLFTDPTTGDEVSIEDIAPDLHMNTAEHLATIKPSYHFGDGPLVKTHYLIPDDAPPYIYLFREPRLCCVSYLNLAAGPEMIERIVANGDSETFNACIKTYLEVFCAMARRALADHAKARCTLMPLARVEAGAYHPFLKLIADGFAGIDQDSVAQILAANPKKSIFDQRLLVLIGPGLAPALATAENVFEELNNAAPS